MMRSCRTDAHLVRYEDVHAKGSVLVVSDYFCERQDRRRMKMKGADTRELLQDVLLAPAELAWPPRISQRT